MNIRCAAVTAEHAASLVRLFEAAACACYCRFWDFAGDDNAWQLRTGQAPHENRAELQRELAAGRLRGMVALCDGGVVGWLRLAPVEAVPKMFARRLYRALPWFRGERRGVLVIGCVLVQPEVRKQGVARGLIAAAVAHARSERATAVEALPRRLPQPVHDDGLWLGPLSVYESLGFRAVAGTSDHPVMRINL